MLMSWSSGGRRRAALLCASCCIPLLFIAVTTSFFRPQYFDKSFLSSKPVQSILITEPTTSTQSTSGLLRPWEPPASTSHGVTAPSHRPDSLLDGWDFITQRDERNFGLSNEQCEKAFPDYYKEIDRAVTYFQEKGNVTEEEVDIEWRGGEIVRVIIYERQVGSRSPPSLMCPLTAAPQ
jgi:hypothetical protein